MESLTAGICQRILAASPEADNEELYNSQPVVQILSLKKIAGNGSGDRYRVIFSDGQLFMQSMLSTQLNSLADSGDLQKFALFRINKFAINYLQNKRLTILLEISLVEHAPEKLGNPQNAEPIMRDDAGDSGAVQSKPAPPVQQVRQTQSNGGEKPPPIVPIEHLSPYNNKWTIKARVVHKSEIKTWSNTRGEGKLFSVTLMDDTGEIKATGFNAVVDDLYEQLQEGKVYFISRARVNLAKKKFTNVQNEYELAFEKQTEVMECTDANDVPAVKYNFVELAQLENLQKDAVCDVIGVVKEIGEIGEIISKSTQKPFAKRDLTIVDRSGYSCRLTLWGKQAENFQARDEPVVAFKGVKVGDFNGRSLSAQSSSTISINPDIVDAHAIRGWYDSVGMESTFQSHTASGGMVASGGGGRSNPVMLIGEAKDQQLGQNEKPDYFTTRATTMHIKPENLSYPACSSEGCNKKAIDTGDGWRCEKCDKSFEKPEHRYIISLAAADLSDQAWLQGFNDVGNALFGVTANELVALRDTDEKAHTRILRKALGNTYTFECRAKVDSYNDSVRVRYGIMRFNEYDYKRGCDDWLAYIAAY